MGEFRAEDKILIANQSGKIKAVIPDLAMHFENDMIVLEKWNPKKPVSVIYFDGNKEKYYVKRFLIEVYILSQKNDLIANILIERRIISK